MSNLESLSHSVAIYALSEVEERMIGQCLLYKQTVYE